MTPTWNRAFPLVAFEVNADRVAGKIEVNADRVAGGTRVTARPLFEA